MPPQVFHRITGNVVVTGYAPDGDSVRFVPHDHRSLGLLHRSERIRVDVDRSVKLRLELAKELPSDEYQLSVPVRALLVEANAAATFVEHNWETSYDSKSKEVVKLGLKSAAGDSFSKSIADEVRALIPLVVDANYDYERTIDPRSPTAEAVLRGRAIVDDITATLEWFLDDGVEDQNDAELAAIEAAHKDDPMTADAIALALEDYVRLATPHVKKIKGLGGFDPKVLDEGLAIAATLRASPVVQGFAATPASRAAIGVRNRYLQLLDERVSRIRKAARFVYRDDPTKASGAMSTYAQRRKAIAKRVAGRKSKPGDEAPDPTATTPAEATPKAASTTR